MNMIIGTFIGHDECVVLTIPKMKIDSHFENSVRLNDIVYIKTLAHNALTHKHLF